MRYLLVAAGGGLGSLLRYLVGVALAQRFGFATRFPLGTFVVNVTGCFAMGLLMTLFMERYPQHPNLRLGLVVGFLGGYTTFSSFEYDAFQAVRDGGQWMGLLYVVSSVVLGYFGVWLGVMLATRR